MKEIAHHIKDIIIIAMLAILSLLLWALFLKVEELKEQIPKDTHLLLDNSIRETIREEFTRDRQEYKFIIE